MACKITVLLLVIFAGLLLLSPCSVHGKMFKEPLDQGGWQKTWCVAKPSSDDDTLRKNFNFSCAQPHVSCGSLAKNGPCFWPDTLINHASVAMHLYYSASGRNPWNCYFGGSALITTTDPSYGTCYYS